MRVTIKDIAKELNLSANTVSKALRNKPQVSEETRALIQETAKHMNYIPSEIARALVRKEMRIAVIYPLEPHEFYQYVIEGIHKAKKELSEYRCTIIEYPFDSLERPEMLSEILRELDPGEIEAVVLTCAHRFEVYQDLLEKLGAAGIPILYNTIFGGNITGVIGGVRMNTLLNGKIAAEYLGMVIPQKSSRKVALLVGEKNMLVHKECIDGFCEDAKKNGLEIIGIYETYEERSLAYELTGRLHRLYPDLSGIYVTSYNSPGVCDWLEDNPTAEQVMVLGHDLYPCLNQKLRTGTLSATLFQNQYELGKESLIMMFEYLTGIRKRENCTKLFVPQIVLSSMVDSFPYYDQALL